MAKVVPQAACTNTEKKHSITIVDARLSFANPKPRRKAPTHDGAAFLKVKINRNIKIRCNLESEKNGNIVSNCSSCNYNYNRINANKPYIYSIIIYKFNSIPNSDTILNI